MVGNHARFTIGEHNLHDEAGLPAPFADVLLFCEAIPPTIRQRLGSRLRGRRVLVCRDQKDLVVVVDTKQFKVTGTLYFLAHKGIEKVTPHRGTFVVKTVHRRTGRKVAFVLEHRINSWWKNERGERALRADLWHEHTDMTLRIIGDLKRENHAVFAGGDLNVPPRVKGYLGHLVEINTALDRLAHSRDVALFDFERLSPLGSDHHRIKATAEL